MALAGTTSTPPGQRERSDASVARRSGVELVSRHQLLHTVDLLLLLEPVREGVVLDLLLLRVVESACVVALEQLVPGRHAAVAALRRPLARLHGEELLLDG